MAETDITLPWSLRYPITIQKILVNCGDQIQKHAPLFSYSYKTTVTETRGIDEEAEVETTLIGTFDAPVEGTVGEWAIGVGDVVENAGTVVVTVSEPCTHAIQYAGMCALCGKDLTFQDYSGYQDSLRANIKMFHNTTGLTVSLEEAKRIEKSAALQLLAARKLILVVDLDQTVIHTTVDPTVGEWKSDPNNPNYNAVKDVVSFCLEEPNSPNGYWYFVKLRPGLRDFLEHVSQMYELHIYTMATKAYARAISQIIDPEGRFFGDRILSRDESGNLEQKNLQRLFPVDTSLVCVIDDRGDVWKWSANLIKVIPYEFFVGIGDINSSFLPKRQSYGLRPSASSPAPSSAEDTSDEASTLHNLIELGGGESSLKLLEEQTELRNALIQTERDERPLAKQQSLLEKSSGSNESNASQVSTNKPPPVTVRADLVEKSQEQKGVKTDTTGTKEQDQGSSDTGVYEEINAGSSNGEASVGQDPVAEASETAESGNCSGFAEPVDDDDDFDLDNITVSDTPDLSSDDDGDDVNLTQQAPRSNLLVDDDEELINLERILTRVHDEYYAIYDSRPKSTVSANKRKRTPIDWKANVPDIKQIMPRMKQAILGDAVILFSGTIPLGVNIDTERTEFPTSADIVLWARSFGATVVEHFSPDITHLIAERAGTRKVFQAKEHPHIKVVTPAWLYRCFSTWVRVPEKDFFLST